MAVEDLEATLGTLQQIAVADDPDDLMQRALQGVAGLIPNDTASFNWMTTGKVSAVLRPQLPASDFERFNAVLATHWHENPLARHFERTADTRALTWTDVEVDRTWRDGPLFRGLYEPLGVSEQMVVRLPSPPGTVAGLALNRAETPFDRRDRDVLTLMGRHIGALLATVAERAAMRTILAYHGWQSILVDDGGRTLDGPFGSGPELGEMAASIRTILRRTAAARQSGVLVPSEPHDVEWRGDRVAVVVAPAAVPPHVVFVRPVATMDPAATDTSALASLGLTQRERQVAAHLSTGATNRQIADALGISVGTVKKHLQHIFQALDAETRTAAAAIVVRHLR